MPRRRYRDLRPHLVIWGAPPTVARALAAGLLSQRPRCCGAHGIAPAAMTRHTIAPSVPRRRAPSSATRSAFYKEPMHSMPDGVKEKMPLPVSVRVEVQPAYSYHSHNGNKWTEALMVGATTK